MRRLRTMQEIRQRSNPDQLLELYKLDSLMAYWFYLLDREIELGTGATTQDEQDTRVNRINDMLERIGKTVLAQQRIMQDRKINDASARLLFNVALTLMKKYLSREQLLPFYEEWRALVLGNYSSIPAGSIEVGRQLAEGDMEDDDE